MSTDAAEPGARTGEAAAQLLELTPAPLTAEELADVPGVLGSIGREVVARARAFGMPVVAAISSTSNRARPSAKSLK